MEANKTERIVWVDFLKGLSIIWLIVYHFYIFGWLRSPVPVFFFLSGLFFSMGDSFSSFLKRKAKALLVPFLLFFTIGVLASITGSYMLGKSFSFPQVWKLFTIIPLESEDHNPLGVGAIWFLISLFELYVVYYAMRRITTNKILLLLFTFLLFLLSVSFLDKYAMGSCLYVIYSCSFLPYFVIAHLFREEILFKSIPKWVVFVSIICYLTIFVQLPNIEIGGGILLRIRNLTSSLGLVILIVYLGKLLNNYLTHRGTNNLFCIFILFEGKNSLTILGIHMLGVTFGKVALGHLSVNGFMYYGLLLLFVFVFSNLGVIIINRFLPFLVNKHSTVKR